MTTPAQQIVARSLEEARRFESQDRLDDAMRAVGRGLAVSPEDSAALAAREALLGRLARQQQKRELEERVARLVGEGRTFLDSGQYSEAASVLKQAASLRPSAELDSLLEDVQSRLLREIEGLEDARRRTALVADGLKEVAALEEEGNLKAALVQLQTVIALDPSNQRAVRLQNRLLEARGRAEQEETRRASIESMLAEAQSDFEAARIERALSTANRVLALDVSNQTALELVARAYREINQRLLGTGTRGNIPTRHSLRRLQRRDRRRISHPASRESGLPPERCHHRQFARGDRLLRSRKPRDPGDEQQSAFG